MKRFTITLISIVICLATLGGCEKKEKAISVVGEWELIGYQIVTKSIQIGDETMEVYLKFNEDNSFAIYQKLGYGRHVEYTGNWTLTEKVLSGKYSDGSQWATTYTIAIEEGNLVMTEDKTGTEKYTYSPCTIPSF